MVALAAAAMMACSDDSDDDGQPTNAGAAPVPGSGATNPEPASGKMPGTIPDLNLEGGAPPSSGGTPDAGEDASAPPTPVPNEPAKRAVWAVDDRGHLLRVLADEPNDVIDVHALGLPAGEAVVGLDFRPANGALYALTTASRIYTVDLVTADATPVGGETNPRVQGQSIGFDVNPAADKIRVHTDVDQNLRIDPATGAVVGTDGTLAFAPGDPNFLQSPNIVGTAYTNSVSPAPASTTLFAVDSTRDLLLSVLDPTDGRITTVGPLGVDILSSAGFDIWGGSEAYLAARVAGGSGTNLYKVDLGTGAATLVGPIAHPHAITAIAVRP